MTASTSTEIPPNTSTASRHLRWGWWSLLVWLSVGIVLEALHGFKIGWYLDVGQEMRRLMFTLGHAHGTLLALVNLAAAASLRIWSLDAAQIPGANAMRTASLLLPVGFILGGITVHDGDPGLGVLLVPIGGVLLVYAVARFATHITKNT